MGIMCCCYVKKNDDYETLDQKSATVESPGGYHRYGTVESARPPETKQYQYPKSPLKQKVSSQSSDSEHRSVRRVRIHVSSSDSDESDDDSPPPIRRTVYSSAPPNIQSDRAINNAPTAKEHAPVTASPSITIEAEEDDKDDIPKTIASGLAAVFKADDSSAEGVRVDAEGASAAESSDPDDSTGGHSSISGNQTGSLDSLNGSEKGGKKNRRSKSSVVRKVGSSVKRASRKASKSMQKGMAKMLHPTKSSESEDRGNGQHKSKASKHNSDDEVENQDESSLTAPSSPMSPTNLSPGPPSPRSPRSISPAHSPISPSRHRTMSYGRRSPSSPSSAHQPLTRMSSDKMQSKYAREKMLEREKQWGKIEAEAHGKQGSAIGQAMQAAHERGQKLQEVEETTGIMREAAFNFAESARHLKEKKRKSAKY